MMRIDAHQHFWVYDQREYAWIDDSMASLRRDFLPNDLKPELERNGFQGSVVVQARQDRKSTRLNSSHQIISYAVFCLKKKKTESTPTRVRTDTCTYSDSLF